MTGKHKRILRDGQTARGPARWFRAADNAMRDPMSPAGQLFWSRAKIAQRFVRRGAEMGPFEHLQRENLTQWPGTPRFEMKRQYVTCSRFCLGMQAQLDFFYKEPAPSVTALVAKLQAGTEWQQVRHLPTLTRSVRCQFCGSTVKP